MIARPPPAAPQALRAALLSEAEASARYNSEVASRWAALYDVEVPQELYEQIERQQQLCCRVIANKQDLIAGEVLASGRCGLWQPAVLQNLPGLLLPSSRWQSPLRLWGCSSTEHARSCLL